MLVESGAVETAGGRLNMVRSIDQLASPESVREVVGQRLRGSTPPRRASSSPRSPAPSSILTMSWTGPRRWSRRARASEAG